VYQSKHDFWAIKRAIRTKIATCGLAEETEKGGRRKSQNRNISPPRGGAISQPILTKFDEFVDLTDFITPAMFGYKIYIGFSRPRVENRIFPIEKHMAYITVPCATALACDLLGVGPIAVR